MSPATTGTVVPMPHMGVSVEEGTVIEWHKEVGDAVAEGELICEIATDKVDTEVLSPAAGTITAILVEVDETVPVGAPLCELDGDASAPGSGTDSRATGSGAGSGAPGAGTAQRAAGGRDENGAFDPAAAADAVTSLPKDGPLASPLARRIAAERGVELSAVAGTGRRGRIRKADVLAAAEAGPSFAGPAARRRAPAPSAAPVLGIPPGYEGVPHEVVPTTRVRQAIAEHMIRSRQTAAHMTTEVDVDLAAVVRARTALNAARLASGDAKLSFLPFIARATCAALAEYPDLNATFQGEQTIRWGQVNLGIAVDTEAGLLVPVIPDAGSLTAPAIGAAIADLAARARDRKLVPDDLAGGTFTISNPGSVGAVSAPAIINQPQVAILGVPTIQRRPWVVTGPDGEEMIAIRSILRLAVTFDHRAVDGADATRFAVAVKHRLESWSTEAYA
ncbi:MAG TPA: dihydrolipoamide acetyltransferase family protein [Solirubrobacterales bacterium]|nr:dihydrolipoamide acetyltransferase family protein [Solirubrobacterales bacterium]